MKHEVHSQQAFITWEQQGDKFNADVYFYEDGNIESKTFTSKAGLDAYLKKFTLMNAAMADPDEYSLGFSKYIINYQKWIVEGIAHQLTSSHFKNRDDIRNDLIRDLKRIHKETFPDTKLDKKAIEMTADKVWTAAKVIADKEIKERAELNAKFYKTRYGNAATLAFNTWIMRNQQGQFPMVYTLVRPEKPGRHEVMIIAPVGQFSINGEFTVTYYVVKGPVPRYYSKIIENLKVRKRRKIVMSKIVQGYQKAITLPRYNFAVTKIYMPTEEPGPEMTCYLTYEQAKKRHDEMLAETPPRCSVIEPDERAAEMIDAWCLRSLDCDVLKLLDELGSLEKNKQLTREKIAALKSQPTMEEYMTKKKYKLRAERKRKFLAKNK